MAETKEVHHHNEGGGGGVAIAIVLVLLVVLAIYFLGGFGGSRNDGTTDVNVSVPNPTEGQ